MSDPKIDSNESEDPQVVNLTNAGTETIKADLVRMYQSGANNIFADEVGMKESGVVGMKAHTVSAHQSGVIALKADEVNIAQGGAVVVQANDVHIQGNAGLVAATEVSMQDGYSLAVASQNLRAERVETLVLLAGKVEGDVTTLIDTRGAILAGLLGGIVSGLFLLMGKLIFRRRK